MSDQNQDQDNLSDALKRSIPGQSPTPGMETGHAEEVEGIMEGSSDQKDKNKTPENLLKE